jgi:fucose 4-O-acetylase-like acetyltransferase
MWSQAGAVADRTPASRNRYIDFLRAVSIVVVVIGHWLVVAPYVETGRFIPGDILSRVPWTQSLSWLFQVMPVFFIVGGYANSASWLAARREQHRYRAWLSTRLRRLTTPLWPLLLVWSIVAVIAHAAGVSPALIKSASQFALLPTWFLMVYLIVVILTPITYKAWTRFGLWSFWGGLAGAALVDVAFFTTGYFQIGWLNYLFIWSSLHQLGYGWQDGRLTGPRRGWLWAIGGLLVLVGLVNFGPYPLSMVTVPGEAVSNTVPPKLPLLALGVFQAGLLLSLEPLVRRWLAHKRLWSVVVLVNGMIMTIYLWHVTALTLLIGLTLALDGPGLTLLPGSAAWWLARPLWLLTLTGLLLPFILIFARFEQPGSKSTERILAARRLIAGAILICAGLAFLAFGGINGEGVLGLRLWVLLPFIGGVFLGVNSFKGFVKK